MGLVKCFLFIVSNVDIKLEVSRSGGRVSGCFIHSDLPAGFMPGYGFVRICHWGDLPSCCPLTSLPGPFSGQKHTYKTDSPLFWHSTSGYKQGCERKLLRGRCVCVFFVCIWEPQMPMFIVLGQTRLKAVLCTSDFFHGMGNLADMEFLIPQCGPR